MLILKLLRTQRSNVMMSQKDEKSSTTTWGWSSAPKTCESLSVNLCKVKCLDNKPRQLQVDCATNKPAVFQSMASGQEEETLTGRGRERPKKGGSETKKKKKEEELGIPTKSEAPADSRKKAVLTWKLTVCFMKGRKHRGVSCTAEKAARYETQMWESQTQKNNQTFQVLLWAATDVLLSGFLPGRKKH